MTITSLLQDSLESADSIQAPLQSNPIQEPQESSIVSQDLDSSTTSQSAVETARGENNLPAAVEAAKNSSQHLDELHSSSNYMPQNSSEASEPTITGIKAATTKAETTMEVLTEDALPNPKSLTGAHSMSVATQDELPQFSQGVRAESLSIATQDNGGLAAGMESAEGEMIKSNPDNSHGAESGVKASDSQQQLPSVATFSMTAAAVTTTSSSSKRPVFKLAVPVVSAWSSPLPGVAPLPVAASTRGASQRATSTKASATQSASDSRRQEQLPIVLPGENEAKLSMDMIDLFESLLPTEESHERRTRLIKKIEHILHTEWPGQDIKAIPFGSTVNDLGTSTSDVDICITTTWSGLKNVQMLGAAFRKHGMQKVFCVPRAKVPIVKLWDSELHLSCDMNINNPLGLANTRMIKTYVAIDPRVRPFAMIIKHWARRRVLNDAANGGTISTYTWICIVINFLQMRSPPILPALHKIPHVLSEDNKVINGNNTSFCEDIAKLEGFGLSNKETLGGLLYAFFRRFAVEFDYDNYVISVREGCYLTKESKGWHLPGKQYKMFCVEEPLDTSRNLGNSSDMASSKGLRTEFRRALDILYEKVSLKLVCQQWVFPSSYYDSRKTGSGNTNVNNYGAGRRYALGYRSQQYYYDGQDDEDEDEDDLSVEEPIKSPASGAERKLSMQENPNGSSQSKEKATSKSVIPQNQLGPTDRQEISTFTTTAITNPLTTASSNSRTPLGNKEGSGNKEGISGTKARKEPTTPLRQEPTGNARTGSRSRQAKSNQKSGQETAAGGTGKKSGSSSKGDHSKRSKGSSGSDGNRSGGGRGGTGNGGNQRVPRTVVELSLADIATAAAPRLSALSKVGQQAAQASHPEGGAMTDGSLSANDGEEKRKKKKSKQQVVWSTNSNRGESRGPAAAKPAITAPQDKPKPIIVSSETDNAPSMSSAPGSPKLASS